MTKPSSLLPESTVHTMKLSSIKVGNSEIRGRSQEMRDSSVHYHKSKSTIIFFTSFFPYYTDVCLPTYRVFGLELRHFRLNFFHDWMNDILDSKVSTGEEVAWRNSSRPNLHIFSSFFCSIWEKNNKRSYQGQDSNLGLLSRSEVGRANHYSKVSLYVN